MSAVVLPPEVEFAFEQNPGLRDTLDEGALQALARANPERAAQVIDELGAKSDVRNPSAFVSSTISKFPMPRPYLHQQSVKTIPRAPRTIHDVLDKYPSLEQALDATALRRLEEVDLNRAADLLDELAQRRDVRNPSAFVVHALGRAALGRMADNGFEAERLEESVLDLFPEIASQLDDRASQRLLALDPARAEQILQDIEARGDVMNPSAFVMKAASAQPVPRGLAREREYAPPMPDRAPPAAPEENVLDYFPEIDEKLDERARRRLLDADPARAEEILQDVAMRGDLHNPSAFVMKALSAQHTPRGPPPPPPRDSRPTRPIHAYIPAQPSVADEQQEVEHILLRFPRIRQRLDNQALKKLADSDPGRVEQVLQDMDAKGDVRNPSAFIVKALSSAPPPHIARQDALHRLLNSHPQLRESLDDAAMHALEACDAERALEVVEDILKKGDVRNPSAFVAASLAKYPQPRGTRVEEPWARPLPTPPPATAVRPSSIHSGHGGPGPSARSWPLSRQQQVHRSRSPVRQSAVEKALSRHRRLAEDLDTDARRKLEAVDPSRAVEIIEEVAGRPDVRNPSAFVMRAITDHPQNRREHPQHRAEVHLDELEHLLARYPQVSAGLDEAAVAKLREAAPDRAEEILEDMAHMGIHNPSAFVVKAVAASRTRRGNPEAPPPLKVARTQYGNGFYPEDRGRGRASEASDLERRGARAGLDEDALRLIRTADPARAAEVLEELELKGREVRNPSAFVSKSLSQYPMPRRR